MFSVMDVQQLRAVQTLAQSQIATRDRVRAQLLRLTADYDYFGTYWVSTVVGIGYVEKPGYMVIDMLTEVTRARLASGVMYQLVGKDGRTYTVDYDHPLMVYRLHDPERLFRDRLQLQIGQAFRRSIKLKSYGDHRYGFSLTIPLSAERYFTRPILLKYLQRHIKQLSAIERVTLTGQGNQTLVEVRLCLQS